MATPSAPSRRSLSRDQDLRGVGSWSDEPPYHSPAKRQSMAVTTANGVITAPSTPDAYSGYRSMHSVQDKSLTPLMFQPNLCQQPTELYGGAGLAAPPKTTSGNKVLDPNVGKSGHAPSLGQHSSVPQQAATEYPWTSGCMYMNVDNSQESNVSEAGIQRGQYLETQWQVQQWPQPWSAYHLYDPSQAQRSMDWCDRPNSDDTHR